MNFQEIRKYYETPVIDACNLAGIAYRPENTLVPDGDAIEILRGTPPVWRDV